MTDLEKQLTAENEKMAGYIKHTDQMIEASREKPVGHRGLICDLSTFKEWMESQ
jgi:hypothetical protein